MVSTERNVSDKLSIRSELRFFFVKILTHYKTDLKNAVTMPLDQLDKVLLSNIEGILSYSGLKSAISCDKNMLLFGKCLELIKINKILTTQKIS